MVLAFEEKYRPVIESNGMTIIEFKRSLYKISKITINVYEIIKDVIDKFEKTLKVFMNTLHKVFDNVKFLCTETMKAYNYPTYQTMRRYMVVKTLSKCTGIEKRKLWKLKRHSWLARSDC